AAPRHARSTAQTGPGPPTSSARDCASSACERAGRRWARNPAERRDGRSWPSPPRPRQATAKYRWTVDPESVCREMVPQCWKSYYFERIPFVDARDASITLLIGNESLSGVNLHFHIVTKPAVLLRR